MTLADTSVWIEFFRQRNDTVDVMLRELIENSNLMAVSVVFGELLQGAKDDKEEKTILEFWDSLPKVDEHALFIEAGKLSRRLRLTSYGVGLADCYILAACRREKLDLWSMDKKLNLAYSRL